MSRQRFEELTADAIMALPQDMKAVLRIVDDPDLEDAERVSVCGSLIHVLSASNAIPGMRGILAYVDDVMVMRLVLERIEKSNPDIIARHRTESPELFDTLDEHLEVSREYLGKLITVLDAAALGVDKLQFQGHSADSCAKDEEASTWLYGAVHEAIVEQLEFDDEEVERETRGIDSILPHLESRVAASS